MSDGSITSQVMARVVTSRNGSIKDDVGSGNRSMSEAWMPFQPAIEEPSKKWPDSNFSGPKALTGTLTCRSLPRVSVKRRSTNLTSLSLIVWNISFGVIIFFLETGFVFMESVTAKNGQHSAIKRKSPRLQKFRIEDFVV